MVHLVQLEKRNGTKCGLAMLNTSLKANLRILLIDSYVLESR